MPRSGASPAEKVSVALRKFWKDGTTRAQVVKNPAALMCRAEMQEILQHIMNAESVGDLDTAVNKYKEGIQMAKQLREGVVKAIGSLKSHISNKQRAATRKATAEKRAQEAEAAEQSKKRAKQAADQLKEDAGKVAPVFSVNFEAAVKEGFLAKVRQGCQPHDRVTSTVKPR